MDRRWTIPVAGVAIATLFFPLRAQAQSVHQFRQGVDGYAGTRDAYLASSEPDIAHDSTLVVSILQPTGDFRGLLAFDGIFGCGTGQLPPGIPIESAELTLNIANGTVADDTVVAHRVLAEWDEASVWNDYGADGLLADGVEAEVVGIPLPAHTGAGGTNDLLAIDVTDDVQAWSNGEAPNRGWLFASSENDLWAFLSSETGTNQRPVLTITVPDVAFQCLTFHEGVGGYTGTQDTFLDRAAPDTSHDTTLVQAIVQPATELQGLLRFDDLIGGGTDQIPSGAQIMGARLTLNIANGILAPGTVSVHTMLTGWDESSTWNDFSGDGISANGIEADASGVDLPAHSGVGGTTDLLTTDVTAAVQAWSDGDQPNLGWVFLSAANDLWAFLSSETGTFQRPRLAVAFRPPTGDALATALSATADGVAELDPGLFDGPNPRSSTGRRTALSNRAQDAAEALDAGNVELAIERMESLLDRVDGVSPPPDWMPDSPEKTALAEEVLDLIDALVAEL